MAALLTSLDAWGDTLPDWVRALAEACEASSQNKVAQQLGYSGALVSNVLRNRAIPANSRRGEQPCARNTDVRNRRVSGIG